MRRGDFTAAWRISDAVLQRRLRSGEACDAWPRHLQFIWTGASLAGKRVLVRCYHGLGDTIQFVRLLEPLRRQAREITLWVQPALLGLLQSARGIDRLEPLNDRAADLPRDIDIELMELPHALRLKPESIPAEIPYIYVSPHALTRGPSFLPARRRRVRDVGIAWCGGEWNLERSIPSSQLATLGRVAGVRWYSLQYPPARLPFGAIDLACEDIVELAQRMQTLDLVISVDTMTAHLAGALGIPVWTMLPEDSDWRWMSARRDSPWYPTMRLFRQRRGGDWTGVIAEAAAALCARARHR